jgi:hypothetical protein
MFQWQSKGFMHHLTSIANECFMSNSTQYMSLIKHPKRMDTALIKLIINLHASIIDGSLTDGGFHSTNISQLGQLLSSTIVRAMNNP